MSDIRTPEQKQADDAEATRLGQSLVNTLVKLRTDPNVAVNALAGALGAYVAMAALDEAQARLLMRLMASVAHEQLELQLAIQRAEASGVVGHA